MHFSWQKSELIRIEVCSLQEFFDVAEVTFAFFVFTILFVLNQQTETPVEVVHLILTTVILIVISLFIDILLLHLFMLILIWLVMLVYQDMGSGCFGWHWYFIIVNLD